MTTPVTSTSMTQRLRGLFGALRRPVVLADDPFDALLVQERLARLAATIRHIEEDETILARGHHWRAALLAYDRVLFEACRLADIPCPLGWATVADPDDARSRAVRFRVEAELVEAGWSW